MPGPAVMARTPRIRRTPQGQRAGTSARGLSQTELREILGAMDRLGGQLPGLERQRVMTTAEAEHFRGLARGLAQRARELARPRRVSPAEARRLREQGRQALSSARDSRELPARLLRLDAPAARQRVMAR